MKISLKVWVTLAVILVSPGVQGLEREALKAQIIAEYYAPGSTLTTTVSLGEESHLNGFGGAASHGTLQLDAFIRSYHVNPRREYQKYNWGLMGSWNAPRIHPVPGHGFLSVGGVVNSNNGWSRFEAAGWKFPGLVRVFCMPVGAGIAHITKLVYPIPAKHVTLEVHGVNTLFAFLENGNDVYTVTAASNSALLFSVGRLF